MDFDEFLELSADTGATAVVDVNIGGDLLNGATITYQELLDAAVEQIRYAKEEGFTGLYWEMGNEIEAIFKVSNIPDAESEADCVQEYIRRYNEFYDAMMAIDPTAKIGPGLYLAAQKNNWQMPVIEAVKDKMAFVVTHQYGGHGFANEEMVYEGYVNNNDPNRHSIRKIQLIHEYLTELGVDQTDGVAYADKLKILVTEYSGYQPSKWKDYSESVIYKGLHSFEMLAEMMEEPSVGPTHFWVTRTPWSSDFEGIKTTKIDHNALNWDGTLTALGKSIAVLSTNMYDTWVHAQTLDDFKVKSYASYDDDTNSLTVFLLNRQNNSVSANVTLNNYDDSGLATSAYVFEGANGNYYDIDYKYEETGAPIVQNGEFEMNLAPASITVVKFTPMPFVISDTSITKDSGISVEASVSPNTEIGFEGGKAAVIFKLMKGDTVIGLYSSEQEITETVKFNAQFHGYSGSQYKVKVYVWNKLDSSVDSIGGNQAAPVVIE